MTAQALPSQNLEAEELVLGAMLLSPNAIDNVTEHLNPNDYFRPAHGLIHQAIVHLHVNGDPVDAITTIDELDKRAQLDQVGGRTRIHELANIVTATANAAHYARIVREMAELRALRDAGLRIIGLVDQREGETRDLIDRAEHLVYELGQHRDTSDLMHVRASLADTYRAVTSGDSTEITGTPTGFNGLDGITTGLQPGNLVIVGARPSMGKSALALCIAIHVAVDLEQPVALFSLEMSRRELDQRLLAIRGHVHLQAVRTGRLNLEQNESLLDAANEFETAPLYIDDSALITTMEIRSRARRLKARHGLALIIVDYLQLIDLQQQKGESKADAVGRASRMLKMLARDLDVPVVALSQLSRESERRGADRRPMLSDLRDSGALEQDADVVVLVHRDGYYARQKDKSKPDRIADLIVAKNRNGRVETVELAWDGPTTTFRNRVL